MPCRGLDTTYGYFPGLVVREVGNGDGGVLIGFVLPCAILSFGRTPLLFLSLCEYWTPLSHLCSSAPVYVLDLVQLAAEWGERRVRQICTKSCVCPCLVLRPSTLPYSLLVYLSLFFSLALGSAMGCGVVGCSVCLFMCVWAL